MQNEINKLRNELMEIDVNYLFFFDALPQDDKFIDNVKKLVAIFPMEDFHKPNLLSEMALKVYIGKDEITHNDRCKYYQAIFPKYKPEDELIDDFGDEDMINRYLNKIERLTKAIMELPPKQRGYLLKETMQYTYHRIKPYILPSPFNNYKDSELTRAI